LIPPENAIIVMKK